jgi:hypothetical protein
MKVTQAPLQISPATSVLSPGASATFTASGGKSPYTYSVVSGGGSIGGTSGVYSSTGAASAVTVNVSDSMGGQSQASIIVSSAALGVYTALGAFSQNPGSVATPLPAGVALSSEIQLQSGGATTVSFGTLLPGHTGTTRTFRLNNSGSSPLTITALSASSGFSWTTTAPITIQPSQSAYATASLTATSTLGVLNGNLGVTSDAPVNPSLAIPVTATVESTDQAIVDRASYYSSGILTESDAATTGTNGNLVVEYFGPSSNTDGSIVVEYPTLISTYTSNNPGGTFATLPNTCDSNSSMASVQSVTTYSAIVAMSLKPDNLGAGTGTDLALTIGSAALGTGACISMSKIDNYLYSPSTQAAPMNQVMAATWVSFNDWNISNQQSFPTVSNCVDSDSGIHPETAGYITITDYRGFTQMIGDSCVGNTLTTGGTDQIREAYCDSASTVFQDRGFVGGSNPYLTNLNPENRVNYHGLMKTLGDSYQYLGPGHCMPVTLNVSGQPVSSAQWVSD